MTIRHYVIPMEPGPYSRGNPQRPIYLDTLQANWSGYPLFAWSRYLCQVNTTLAKHTTLEGQAGVIALPDDGLDRTIASLPVEVRTRMQNLLAGLGVAYVASETVEELIRRIITTSDPNGTEWDPRRVYMDEF